MPVKFSNKKSWMCVLLTLDVFGRDPSCNQRSVLHRKDVRSAVAYVLVPVAMNASISGVNHDLSEDSVLGLLLGHIDLCSK